MPKEYIIDYSGFFYFARFRFYCCCFDDGRRHGVIVHFPGGGVKGVVELLRWGGGEVNERTPPCRVAFTLHTQWVYPGGNVGRSPRQHPRPDGNVDLWRARCMCLCVRLYVLYGYYSTSRRGKDNAAASREYIKQRVADRSNTSQSVTIPILQQGTVCKSSFLLCRFTLVCAYPQPSTRHDNMFCVTHVK